MVFDMQLAVAVFFPIPLDFFFQIGHAVFDFDELEIPFNFRGSPAAIVYFKTFVIGFLRSQISFVFGFAGNLRASENIPPVGLDDAAVVEVFFQAVVL